MNLALKIKSSVLEGRDGYLFAMDDPGYLKIILGDEEIQTQPLSNFRENMKSRKLRTQERNVPWAHIVIPDKPTVIPAQFPADEIRPVGQVYVQNAGEIGGLIYPLTELCELQKLTSCYSRLDSHPSHPANVTMLRCLMESLQIYISDEIWKEIGASSRLQHGYGDLGHRFGATVEDTKLVTSIDWPARTFDNGLQAMIDGMMTLHINRSAMLERRLLVFGDSSMLYLISLASRIFREVLFCRSLFMHDEILDSVCPDYVLTGNSDRYRWLRSDRERPIFLAMPAMYAIPLPKRPEFWQIADAIMMTRWEPQRFQQALSAIIDKQ